MRRNLCLIIESSKTSGTTAMSEEQQFPTDVAKRMECVQLAGAFLLDGPVGKREQAPRTPYASRGAVEVLLSFVLASSCWISSSRAEDKINYTDQVLPLVEANCSKCHNSDKKKAD